jgi:hypothetical protein
MNDGRAVQRSRAKKDPAKLAALLATDDAEGTYIGFLKIIGDAAVDAGLDYIIQMVPT